MKYKKMRYRLYVFRKLFYELQTKKQNLKKCRLVIEG